MHKSRSRVAAVKRENLAEDMLSATASLQYQAQALAQRNARRIGVRHLHMAAEIQA